MLIDTAGTVQTTSNVTPDGQMGISEGALVHIMGVLTNLYGDKWLAVIREYSTNARDSHIAAGKEDVPIEVTLPTDLNPTLVISDHGVGLSRTELLEVYSQYGASTKRNTNSQVGSFGLGSKSAFTIGGQFVVTARKDGVQCSAVFALNEHGAGTVNILAEHATTEGNGVTVSISVSEPDEMQEAAQRFFKAWKPGTVLVDGATPENFFDAPESMWISDDILFTNRGGITVVMGGVAYPVPSSAVYTVRSSAGLSFPTYGQGAPGLVVFVPIGAVDITPSREGIRDTERSLRAVSDVLRTLPAALSSKISDALSGTDQLQSIFASRKLLAAAEHLNVKVSGALPAKIALPPGSATQFSLSSRGGLVKDDLDGITAQTVHLLTVLVGVPERRSAKRHAKAWIDANGSRKSLIMFGSGNGVAGSTDWFRYGGDSPVSTVHFDDIELPAREYSYGARAAITYSTSEGSMTPSEIKATGKRVAFGSAVFADHPALAGYLLVRLSGRQSLDVFLRRVPGAVGAGPLISAHNAATLKALGDTSELARGYRLATAIDRIKYALGHRASELTHSAWLSAQQTAAAYNALSRDVQMMVQREHHYDREEATAPLFKALPLLKLAHDNYSRLSDAAITHMVAYVNAQK